MTITTRIDAITRIPPESRRTVCPAPKSVKIELTAHCDLRCFFCATSHNLRKKGSMDFEFLKHLLYELRQDGVDEIGMFYLGESMLYKKLPDAIDYAKHVVGFPYVFLTTNGRAVTPELLRRLFTAGLDSLKFSINSADREQYKSVCGVDAFDTVIKNIKSAKAIRDEVERELGYHCGLYASSIQFDGEQHAKMQTMVNDITPHIDEHYWLPLYGQAGLTAGIRGTRPVAGNIGRVGALRDSLPCWALFTEGHVTWNGILTGCCFSHTPAFDFGDLNTLSFMEAWNSEAAQLLRDANLKKDVTGTACEKCIAYATS